MGMTLHVPPPRTFPFNIVKQIFLYSLPDNPRIAKSESPLALTQVCHSWRNAANEIPELWNKIVISVNLSEKDEILEGRSLLVNRWLSTAGKLPLSITIRATMSEKASGAAIWDLMDTLVSFSGQWKTMDLEVPSSSLRPLQKVPPFGLSILESFSFKELEDGIPLMLVRLRDFHFLGPSLKHLTLLFIGYEQLTSDVGSSDWALGQLIPDRYDKQRTVFTARDAIEILRKYHALETCTLHINSKVKPIGGPLVVHNNLVALTIVTMGGWDLKYIFNPILLPSIRQLLLCCGWYRPSNFIPGFNNLGPFLSHVNRAPQLTHLGFSAQRVPFEIITRVLSAATRITHLSITACQQLDDRFLDTLNIRFPNACCPRLECLSLLGVRSISDRGITRFLRGRAGTELKKLEMSVYRPRRVPWLSRTTNKMFIFNIETNITYYDVDNVFVELGFWDDVRYEDESHIYDVVTGY